MNKEYECIKEIIRRLRIDGEKEITLTKASILLFLLYREDMVTDNVFAFNGTFRKNVYGIPSDEDVNELFKLYDLSSSYGCNKKVNIKFNEEQEKLMDLIINKYGKFSPAQLLLLLEQDKAVKEARIYSSVNFTDYKEQRKQKTITNKC